MGWCSVALHFLHLVIPSRTLNRAEEDAYLPSIKGGAWRRIRSIPLFGAYVRVSQNRKLNVNSGQVGMVTKHLKSEFEPFHVPPTGHCIILKHDILRRSVLALPVSLSPTYMFANWLSLHHIS